MLHRFKFAVMLIVVFAIGLLSVAAFAAHPNGVVWEGDEGPGLGKHIAFISGDYGAKSSWFQNTWNKSTPSAVRLR